MYGKNSEFEDGLDTAPQQRMVRGGGSISSAMVDGDDGVGRGVAERRMNLLDAMKEAEPQVGRREPAQYDPWPKRKMMITGIAAGLVVVVGVIVLVVVLGANTTLA